MIWIENSSPVTRLALTMTIGVARRDGDLAVEARIDPIVVEQAFARPQHRPPARRRGRSARCRGSSRSRLPAGRSPRPRRRLATVGPSRAEHQGLRGVEPDRRHRADARQRLCRIAVEQRRGPAIGRCSAASTEPRRVRRDCGSTSKSTSGASSMMPAARPTKSPGGASSVTSLPETRARSTPNVRMPARRADCTACTPSLRMVLPAMVADLARATPIPTTSRRRALAGGVDVAQVIVLDRKRAGIGVVGGDDAVAAVLDDVELDDQLADRRADDDARPGRSR